MDELLRRVSLGWRGWSMLPPKAQAKVLFWLLVSLLVLWLLWHETAIWFAALMTFVWGWRFVSEIKTGPTIELDMGHQIIIPDFTAKGSSPKSLQSPPASPPPPRQE